MLNSFNPASMSAWAGYGSNKRLGPLVRGGAEKDDFRDLNFARRTCFAHPARFTTQRGATVPEPEGLMRWLCSADPQMSETSVN